MKKIFNGVLVLIALLGLGMVAEGTVQVLEAKGYVFSLSSAPAQKPAKSLIEAEKLCSVKNCIVLVSSGLDSTYTVNGKSFRGNQINIFYSNIDVDFQIQKGNHRSVSKDLSVNMKFGLPSDRYYLEAFGDSGEPFVKLVVIDGYGYATVTEGPSHRVFGLYKP